MLVKSARFYPYFGFCYIYLAKVGIKSCSISIVSAMMLANYIYIKTHGSESRGQEEAACTRVFWPTRPLQ